MKFRSALGACALFLGGALAAYAFTAQGSEEMMSPGEHHKILEDKVGKWKMTVKTPASPMGPASESPGTAEMKLALGGRFIQDNTSASVAGMPFTGIGYTGYDNMKKKYVSIWMDSMNTGILSSEGTYDAATKTLTLNGEMPDQQGGMMPMKIVETATDKDNWSMKMSTAGPDGKDMQLMEIVYARAK